MRMVQAFGLLTVLVMGGGMATAQDSASIAARYTKTEYRISFAAT